MRAKLIAVSEYVLFLFCRNAIVNAMPSLQQLDGKDVFETDNDNITGDYDQFDPERKLAKGNKLP